MESLDPRLRRLDLLTQAPEAKEALDQLPTYEVFVQVKEPRAYKHEGCVHANSLAMALIFAKEQFSRRGMCSGIWVVDTRDVLVTDYSENEIDIYDPITGRATEDGQEYAVFHMIKRGTQHSFAGNVTASSPEAALEVAKEVIERKKPVLNAWIIPLTKMLKTDLSDREMWQI